MNLISLLLVIVTAASAQSVSNRPKPPAGFTWQEVPEIRAAFLKPAHWFFRKEANGTTIAVFITREDIGTNRQFSTGLTVNVFPKAKPGTAVQYAKSFIDQLAAKKTVIERWAKIVGPLETFGCRVKDTDSSGTSIIHNLMVANPRTGTLYFFIFEAPLADWTDAWLMGEKIMNVLAVDDDM